jgi:hypothetical protein
MAPGAKHPAPSGTGARAESRRVITMDDITEARNTLIRLEAGLPPGGDDPSADDSDIVLHPQHHVAKAATSVLRKIALFLLIAGGTLAILWRTDLRQPGSLGGTAGGVVTGFMLGTVSLAVAIAVVAYIVDLLFLIDWNARAVPARVDDRN